MQKKQKSNKLPLLLGAMLVIALVGFSGCPTDDGGEDGGGTPKPTIPPITPAIIQNQTGSAFVSSVDLNNPPADAVGTDQATATVAFTWEGGEGAETFNVYWSEDNAQPTTAGITGIKEKGIIVDGLKFATTYYFWVEAVNSIGTTFSASSSATTRTNLDNKPGWQDPGATERGDYPRTISIVPGNNSLTVNWNHMDRVGWYEVYYAKVDDIQHLDIYTPTVFPDSGAFAGHVYLPPAYDIDSLYPLGTPLAPNSGYEGYQVGKIDGIYGSDSRPVLGVESFGTAGTTPTYPPEGAFAKIGEAWMDGDGENDLEKLQPYKKLDAAFAKAIPWDGEKAGTPGTAIKYMKNSVTITGLENNVAYEVWIRGPNTNGERGYGYIVGTPGGASLGVPGGITVSNPTQATRSLDVAWDAVSGADSYRVYYYKFPFINADTPSLTVTTTNVTLPDLDPATEYFVWIVAEKGGLAGNRGNPVSGETASAPATGKTGDKVITETAHKVKTAVYVEVNDRNPLNAGNYVLEDGTYLFDYVILFAANIRNRNCAAEGAAHGCENTGTLHVHLNENVRTILEQRTKYIKPLQDKGIKVLLGLLGDHDGVGFASLTDAGDPNHSAATDRAIFIADVKKIVDQYGLDGVDFDDEWASKEDWNMNDGKNPQGTTATAPSASSIWTYPVSEWGWPYSMTIYRDPIKGIEPGNGILTAPTDAAMATMWKESGESYYKTIIAARAAMPEKIICLYEYNTGRYITEGGNANTTATLAGLEEAVDFALQPWYNRYIAESANGLPHSKYSPFGIDIGGHAYASFNGAAYPPISDANGNEQATGTIYDYSTQFKNAATANNPYNILYFYGLEESSLPVKRYPSETTATTNREAYISHMTEVIFGQRTMLTTEGEAGDYRKDW